MMVVPSVLLSGASSFFTVESGTEDRASANSPSENADVLDGGELPNFSDGEALVSSSDLGALADRSSLLGRAVACSVASELITDSSSAFSEVDEADCAFSLEVSNCVRNSSSWVSIGEVDTRF